MTERKSRLDPKTKQNVITIISAIIIAASLIAVMLIVLTYFQREEIITDLELAKNATQTVVFNFTGGNP